MGMIEERKVDDAKKKKMEEKIERDKTGIQQKIPHYVMIGLNSLTTQNDKT